MLRPMTRGVSLVEAIVAMAVMAFGMLAIVGLQSTLRLNSDVAKQRSEAVRIAQEAIERWRAYSAMDTTAGVTAYEDIDTTATANVTGYTTNTTYTLTRTVNEEFGGALKSLQVVVDWTDRAGQAQRVEIDSIVARSDPGLSGALSMQPVGYPVRQPLGRNPAVPVQAVDIGGGKSAYKPPGASSIVWVLNNLSGVITSVCNFPGSDLSQLVPATDCSEAPSYLITGFVRFSFGASPNALTPTDEQIPLAMLAVAVGVEFADGECVAAPVQDPKLTYTSYACRVPQGADTTWTGTTLVSYPLDPAVYDVCRYVIDDAVGNAAHPQVYVHLDRSLTNQNFLVVDEGVACPTGTLPHQPPL